MSIPILRLDHINASIGGVNLLQDICLSVKPKERICLVGCNGSGKSTLLKIAANIIEPQSGTVFIHGSSTIGYLEQNPNFSDFSTIYDYINHKIQDTTNISYSLKSLLKKFNLNEQDRISHLSVGQSRCVALIKMLILQPDILILDEPTNHLDFRTIHWMEQELLKINSAIIFVSHDRCFLKNLSTTTVWLDRGCLDHMNKGFAHFELWKQNILEQEQIRYHNLKKKNESEEEWLRYGVTARRKRNVRRVKELQEIKTQLKEQKNSFYNTIQTNIQSTLPSSGKLVIEADKITKQYDNRSIVKNFSLRIHYGERIGIVGPNGAGKTTLLKLLTGKITPDSGLITLGTNLKIAIIDQKRENINPNETLASYLTGSHGDSLMVQGESRHVAGYIKDFLFHADQAYSLMKNLSGGEKMRAIIARILAQPFNFLIMDEPTNDLDFETLDFLEKTISNLKATILIVSHDRDFLDRTVTSTIAVENIENPNGYWVKYAGGYSDMLAQQKKSNQTSQIHNPQVQSLKKKYSTKETKQQQKKSLTYSQKLLLERLPQEIYNMQLQISEKEQQIIDKKCISNKEVHQLYYDLAQIQQEIKDKEEQWIKLEMMQEENMKKSDE
ncbi:ABC-F family ATP-binding cassette domain-containing protein [Candidatus Liberibacter africanus]|uniref:Putative ABC transporter ATP-binding protein n=1 Tax=Candidatus Liberibacter africanus PTSAPSY TaxID=1277257 RepID=A0A0G3I9W0_LIBAF|nr:ABC-F family ATP-binding cassette domain-containing protein [Candidatus Liberibacter africanus]AKK20592.1 putative ABC transporter ATP-binding protein [Candidatus Liberibacter africanus PTSAPSY]QTP64284.1 ABC-F family ATP-binding cassette domain-containing protein [Candidatus Liberibacter africanus]